jgi:serpin B
MVEAFGMTADFSGMDGTKSLYIGMVQHDAFVNVDEKGTEASAATIVDMRRKSMPRFERMTVNRPFYFMIHDANGAPLFLGHVVDPVLQN